MPTLRGGKWRRLRERWLALARLLGELQDAEWVREAPNQQPCLQTDLALIDIPSNRCIHHSNTVMKTGSMLNTDAYLRAEGAAQVPGLKAASWQRRKGGFLKSHSASPWTRGEWPLPSRADWVCLGRWKLQFQRYFYFTLRLSFFFFFLFLTLFCQRCYARFTSFPVRQWLRNKSDLLLE